MALPIETTLERLKQSPTARALLLYLPSCWLTLQVVALFMDQFGLPRWVFTGVLVLLGIGLLGVLLMARQPAQEGGEVLGADPQGEGPPSRRFFTRRRLLLGVFAAVMGWGLLTLGYMGARAAGIGPFGTLIASGDLDPSDQVLVANFINRTSDPGLSQTVAEALAVDLSQSRLVRVLDSRGVAPALERMKKPPATPLTPELAREVALREGIPAVLEGEVAALGSATVVRARLVDASDGEVLAESSHRARSPDDLLTVVDRVSGELRNKVGESLKVLRNEPALEQVTTSSLPALRLYTQAQQRIDAGDETGARTLLEEALELDPEFAMAWRKLGTLIGNSGRDRAGAVRAYTNAYLFRVRLPERERGLATGSYFQQVEGDQLKAAAAFRAVAQAYPQEVAALNNLALAHSEMQQFAVAEPLYKQVTALAPERIDAHWNVFLTQLAQRKVQEAAATHAASLQRFPDTVLVDQMGVMVAYAQGDRALAWSRARAMTRSRPGDPAAQYYALALMAPMAAEEGRYAESERLGWEMAELNANAAGDPASALTVASYIAQLYDDRGRQAEARAILADALERWPLSTMDPEQRPHWRLAEAYGALEQVQEARAHLALAEAQGAAKFGSGYGLRDAVLGRIAAAEGDWSQAIAHFQAASEYGQHAFQVLPELGRAYEAAGQTQQAIAAYERYVANTQETREQLGLVLGRLVELTDGAGAADKARTYAAQLATLWVEADPGLQPQVRLARARAARAAAAPAQG